jgi:hypothetical protein
MKWRAEPKDGYSVGLYICSYDMMVGGREEVQIELGSDDAKFAFDIFRFTWGLGAIGTGVYDFVLAPRSEPMPGLPAELKLPASKYKAAFGLPAWSPIYEDVDFESNSGMFGGLIERIFEDAIGCDEARDGQVPVIWFTGTRERSFPAHGATYSAPVAERVGWLPRALVASFAMHEITVQARPLLENKPSFALLGVRQPLAEKLATPSRSILKRPTMTRGTVPKHNADDDLNDDTPF